MAVQEKQPTFVSNKTSLTLKNTIMEEKKNNGTKGAARWKEVVIGGISGIALGAAGTLFASSIPLDASAENVDTDTLADETENANVAAQMATNVTDSMSFSDAFNAARAEVGAGGVFEWHGNLYSTYTADEWNNMDDAARNEFAESIHWDGPSHEYVASNHSHSTHNTEDVHQSTNTTANTNTQNQTPEKEDEESPDVEIIGIEHANIDGEHESIIGAASINGQAVYFIDVDGEDDEFELMVADTNGNNQIDDGEVIDISEQHMSVSHFEQLAQANQLSNNNEEPVQYYANNEDLPDYVNDADSGTLA